MSNIATLLKEEIARQARKEVRSETEGLKKASSHYRSEIAALKRRIALLEQQVSKLLKQGTKSAPVSHQPAEVQNVRFRADGLKKHRERLGLSGPLLASILEVSPQTIYNWEAGSSRPSKEQIAKIAILRKMGKREVQQRVAQMRAA